MLHTSSLSSRDARITSFEGFEGVTADWYNAKADTCFLSIFPQSSTCVRHQHGTTTAGFFAFPFLCLRARLFYCCHLLKGRWRYTNISARIVILFMHSWMWSPLKYVMYTYKNVDTHLCLKSFLRSICCISFWLLSKCLHCSFLGGHVAVIFFKDRQVGQFAHKSLPIPSMHQC